MCSNTWEMDQAMIPNNKLLGWKTNVTSSSAEAVVIAVVPDGYYDDTEDDEDNINTTDVN